MGYNITMIDCNFCIKKENFGKALVSLKSVFTDENMTCSNVVTSAARCITVEKHFSWVNTEAVMKSNTLAEALTAIRFFPSTRPGTVRIHTKAQSRIIRRHIPGSQYPDVQSQSV